MYLRTNNKYDCCGCSACEQICPKKCISLQTDLEGFYYPIKDSTFCIDCGLCEKVCPFTDNHNIIGNDNPDVFAAYDKNNRNGSSSGGLFYTLAKYIIEEKKGWVFGAAFVDGFQLCHIGVNNIQDLEKLRGSKYLQSKMGCTYQKIKNLLKEDIYVLFVGTPCQVAGLKSFLRKEYQTLFTADLVCHGVPSQLMFDKHVKYLEKINKSKLSSYKFRYDDGWGVCEIADFAHPKKHIELPSYDLSPYLYSFMYAMTYRYSCYNCKFARIPREGDITLADYWGVKEFFPSIDVSKGVSLVLLNTPKAYGIWEMVKRNCEYYESNIANGAKYNKNLLCVSQEPTIRKTIYNKIEEQGYEKIAKTIFKSPRFLKIKILTFIKGYRIFSFILATVRKHRK